MADLNRSKPDADPGDFPDGWVRLRILPESDQFPGTRVSRMKRAIKCLGRSFGIRVEGFRDEPPATVATIPGGRAAETASETGAGSG